MKFFLINRKNNKNHSYSFLKKNCNKLGLQFNEINVDNFEKVKITRKDILYRLATDVNSKNIEKMLVKYNPKTLYHFNNLGCLHLVSENVVDATIQHQSENIPMPKTSFINTLDQDRIARIIKKVGGFPVVIKKIGEQKGIGIDKTDNLKDLINITKKYINQKTPFIIREYIDSPGISFRSIVVDNKVITTYKNTSVHKDDFRSNIDQSQRIRKIVKISKFQENIIIKAVKILGVDFGAVDFLYDNDGHLKILEVNFPCNFAPAQELSKINIAEKIILFLSNKK